VRILNVVLLVIFTSFGFAFAGGKEDGCMKCHRLRGLSVLTKDNKIKDCSIRESLYVHSAHRKVGCRECHNKVKQYPHKVENVKANCSNLCHLADPSTKKPFSHEKIFKTWKESVHGRNYEKAPSLYPDCSYCHTNQLLVEPEKSFSECLLCHSQKNWVKEKFVHVLRKRRDGWEVVELCSSCHEDKEKMKKAIDLEGIKDKFEKEKILFAVDSYKITMHAKMLYLDREDKRAADCLDCHTNKEGNLHDIFRKNDSRSSVNQKNIQLTCGRSTECHPLVLRGNMTNFATTKWVHMRPLPEDTGQKVVCIIEAIFKTLVFVVLTFACLIVILDLRKTLFDRGE